MLEPTTLYVVCFGCLVGAICLQKVLRGALDGRQLVSLDRAALERRRWNGIRITGVHTVAYILYLAGNGIFLCWGVADGETRAKRAAIAAATNLAPIFLGGRTNFLADRAGISLQSYYLAHHWLARLATVEASLHGVMRGGRWTRQAIIGLVVRTLFDLT
jgi:hypothetical protein